MQTPHDANIKSVIAIDHKCLGPSCSIRVDPIESDFHMARLTFPHTDLVLKIFCHIYQNFLVVMKRDRLLPRLALSNPCFWAFLSNSLSQDWAKACDASAKGRRMLVIAMASGVFFINQFNTQLMNINNWHMHIKPLCTATFLQFVNPTHRNNPLHIVQPVCTLEGVVAADATTVTINIWIYCSLIIVYYRLYKTLDLIQG